MSGPLLLALASTGLALLPPVLFASSVALAALFGWGPLPASRQTPFNRLAEGCFEASKYLFTSFPTYLIALGGLGVSALWGACRLLV
jgi:hypothetical protein